MKRRYLGVILVLMFAATLATPQVADAKTAQLTFDVFLNDKKIGEHQFDLSTDRDVFQVRSTAKFKYTVFFIPAYRYRHSNVERWRDDCLVDIRAETNANGKYMLVHGMKEVSSFVVKDLERETELPECVMSFAYWNPRFLDQQRLLNQQTGEYVDVVIENQGVESIVVRGEAQLSTRYSLSAPDAELTLWYSSNNEWLALESVAANGHVIRYELT